MLIYNQIIIFKFEYINYTIEVRYKLTKLMLLGLLSQRNLTGYEIKQYLSLSDAENWAKIKTGSIYYALKKMEDDNLIEVQSVEYTGNRSRTVYSITEKGKSFFKKKLESTLSKADVNFPSSLYTSVTFLEKLPYEKAVNAVDKHINNLKKELKNWKSAEKSKKKVQSRPLPQYMEALFTNGRRHIKANIEFLEKIKELLSEESFEIQLPPLNEEK